MLREIFSDNNGHLSSKRIAGALMIVAAIVLNVFDAGDAATTQTLIWAGAAALGVGTLETRVSK